MANEGNGPILVDNARGVVSVNSLVLADQHEQLTAPLRQYHFPHNASEALPTIDEVRDLEAIEGSRVKTAPMLDAAPEESGLHPLAASFSYIQPDVTLQTERPTRRGKLITPAARKGSVIESGTDELSTTLQRVAA